MAEKLFNWDVKQNRNETKKKNILLQKRCQFKILTDDK